MRTEDGYIIHKCLNEDSEAYGLLVDKYKAGVYAIAYSKLRNFHDAEDVTQEVFIRAYEKLHTLRRWDSFASWLYRIAYSLCRRWLRSQSRRRDREFIEDNDTEILEHHSLDSHREEFAFSSLHEALDSMAEDHRQVLMLHYFGGMTSYEIARFVGMAPATIRRKLIKARESLKTEMLAPLDTVFQEQKLPASFTLQILEIVRHIRAKPLPRLAEIPWGMSAAVFALAIILSLGIFGGVREIANHRTESLISETEELDEVPIDIIKREVIEEERDTNMLSNSVAVICQV